MTEKELVLKIRELRQISPRKDWVVFTKREILGEEEVQNRISWLEFFPRILFQYKLAFASLVLIGIVVCAFGLSQNAVPGDLLFSLKKITERTQTAFVPSDGQLKNRLELANKRLEELTKIAEQNQAKKLASAIGEYQTSMEQVADSVSAVKKPEEARKVVPEIKKLEGNIQNLKSYGVEIGEETQTEDLYKPIVEVLIKDLEAGTLTEEQKIIFEETKNLYQAGDYFQALEKILILSSPK